MKLNVLLYSFFLGLVFLIAALPGRAQQAYTIFNHKGKAVSVEQLMRATKGKSHIFFGEFHNNPIAHWLQVEMTKVLHTAHGGNLAIGAEMFEADNQLLINEYFTDQIKQKSFEEEARLWKNYKTDYKPILEFAKKNKLVFVATNVPRRYANSVFYEGIEILNQLSVESKFYMAPLPIVIDTSLKSYQEIQKMAGDHNGEFMMEAQAIKDATMAFFILQNTKEATVFFHLNGAYHSNRYEGVLSFLMPKIDRKNILTISTVSQADVATLEQKNLDLADFVICVDEDMTVTH